MSASECTFEYPFFFLFFFFLYTTCLYKIIFLRKLIAFYLCYFYFKFDSSAQIFFPPNYNLIFILNIFARSLHVNSPLLFWIVCCILGPGECPRISPIRDPLRISQYHISGTYKFEILQNQIPSISNGCATNCKHRVCTHTHIYIYIFNLHLYIYIFF